jgi:hypothetical protein
MARTLAETCRRDGYTAWIGSARGSNVSRMIRTRPVTISSVNIQTGITAMPAPLITASLTASELSARNRPRTATVIGPSGPSKCQRLPVARLEALRAVAVVSVLSALVTIPSYLVFAG